MKKSPQTSASKRVSFLEKSPSDDIYSVTPWIAVWLFLLCALHTSVRIGTPSVVQCVPGVPCRYPEQVDLRVIVITYNRPESLRKCLNALQQLQVNGDKAMMEIWIDVAASGDVNQETYKMATEFIWVTGAVRVHVHETKAGLMGQWLSTWSPGDADEVVLYVEDDVDVSPHAYTWLKHAWTRYHKTDQLCGITLQDEYILVATGPARGTSLSRPGDLIFSHTVPGSWGFAPFPRCWREFQTWYHIASRDADFLPYLPEAGLYDKWYQDMVSEGRKDTMWIMWFIHFMYHRDYNVIHSNLPEHTREKNSSLAVHRKEKGLHFTGKTDIDSQLLLLTHWQNDYVLFPSQIKHYSFDGGFKGEEF